MKQNQHLDKPSPITGTIKIDLIKQFMKKRKLSETQFAEKCHITLKELQKVLDDFSCFEPITLLNIARFMCLEFGDLVNSHTACAYSSHNRSS